jgi:RNA polymerase primary sigma factor
VGADRPRGGRPAKTPSGAPRPTRPRVSPQIGKIGLLNAEQEVQLAQRIEAGLSAAERLRRAEDATEKLSRQLRRDLRWIVRDGQRAKNHLLEANLRLVVSLA